MRLVFAVSWSEPPATTSESSVTIYAPSGKSVKNDPIRRLNDATKTLKFRQCKWAFNLGSPFPPYSLNKFGRIFSDDAVSSGTVKVHLERLEIMICRLRRDLSDQRISERYNVLLGDLSHRVIRALAEKLQKLRKTAAIKNHRRCSSLRLLAIKPIAQILAQAGPHHSFSRKFLMQSIQNRLCLPQTPLCPGSLFVFIREALPHLRSVSLE
jgi:hypothetical protein